MRKMKMIATAAAALLVLGCGGKDDTVEADKQRDEDSKAAAETEALEEARSEVRADPEAPRPALLGRDKLSASHILLMHEGSQRKPPEITRSRDEAVTLAQELAEKIKGGADFAELAKEHSDCPSGKQKGGDLGAFPANRMAPEFSRGVLELEVGGVSEPVESPFGYHIIKRQEVDEVQARHILVMHEGSTRKPPHITRSKDEAEKLIEEVERKLKDGADFAELAGEHSDCPSGKRAGGDLGSFGRGRMARPFEEAAWALGVDEISGIVETDFGYHVIQRLR